MGRYQKHLIKILVCFSLICTPFFSHAGAAEKWEYEPKMKDLNIEVKAHKVDQYGDAVNDYEYNTKVDPKTTANKQKMGTVGMGRLLKTNLYSALGNYALEQLLNAVDWVIDPAAQSIWRNKKVNGNGNTVCSGGYLFNSSASTTWYTCPQDAAQAYIDLSNKPQTSGTYSFTRWLDDPFLVERPRFTMTFTYKDGRENAPVEVTLNRKVDPNSAPEKEYLTPEALADYANHTHPDYTDPQRSPKIEPKYSPEIAEKLWKPGNEWEYENSPTVQEVKKELEKADPAPKDDTIKENQPDPETGQNSWSLPKACDWFPKACAYFDWMREEPEQTDDKLDIPDENIEATDTNISFDNSCPAPITVPVSWNGNSIDFDFSFDMFCQSFGTYVKPIIIALGAFHAVLIVSGVRINE